jgi:FKBP-type peptidyl-prolyl cis-trans isomerase FkpA
MRTIIFTALCSLFLIQTACKQNQGVKTPNGHMFTNHTNGQGAKVQPGEVATINMYVYINDSLVQSTVRDQGGPRELMMPTTENMPKKVPPYLEAIQMMAKGDSATIIQTVDSTLAKGIPPSFGVVKEIRFVLKVVDVMDKAGVEKKQKEEQMKADVMMAKLPEVKGKVEGWLSEYKGKKLANLQKSATGLEYVILEQGTGAQLKMGEEVPTHYYGCLMSDAKPFDNSFERGGPAPFTIGRMIPGFDEGLLKLNHGGKAVFFIPYALGYGDKGTPDGTIPAKSNLVFYVEVE